MVPALIDTGAEGNMISYDLCMQIGLKIYRTPHNVSQADGISELDVVGVVHTTMIAENGVKLNFDAVVVKKLKAGLIASEAFLEEHKIVVDVPRRQLVMPDNRTIRFENGFGGDPRLSLRSPISAGTLSVEVKNSSNRAQMNGLGEKEISEKRNNRKEDPLQFSDHTADVVSLPSDKRIQNRRSRERSNEVSPGDIVHLKRECAKQIREFYLVTSIDRKTKMATIQRFTLRDKQYRVKCTEIYLASSYTYTSTSTINKDDDKNGQSLRTENNEISPAKYQRLPPETNEELIAFPKNRRVPEYRQTPEIERGWRDREEKEEE